MYDEYLQLHLSYQWLNSVLFKKLHSTLSIYTIHYNDDNKKKKEKVTKIKAIIEKLYQVSGFESEMNSKDNSFRWNIC